MCAILVYAAADSSVAAMCDSQTKAGPLSALSREKLEDQTLQLLQQYKSLRRQNDEFRSAIKDLEGRLNAQILINQQLQDENQRLQSRAGAFGITSIGKTLTSMIGRRSVAPEFASGLGSVSVPPIEGNEDNPQVLQLKSLVAKLMEDVAMSKKNESAIRDFAAELQAKSERKETDLESLQGKLRSVREENSRLVCELATSDGQIDTLNRRIGHLEVELAEFKTVSAQVGGLIEANSDLQELSVKYHRLLEQYDFLKDEMVQLRVAKEETERQNVQMGELLKKSSAASKSQESEVHRLSQSLQDLGEERAQLEMQLGSLKELNAHQDSEIQAMRRDVQELEERLEKGKSSLAVEAKMAQVQKMIAKSNEMYAAMYERAGAADARVKELEVQIHQLTEMAPPTAHFLSPIGEFVLCANGRYFKGQAPETVQTFVCREQEHIDHKQTQAELAGGEEKERDHYLRQLVLQYFRADEKARKPMTTVILGVLGLDEVESRAILSGERTRNRFTFF
jgi:DNA repair exonuclease SbcCD ATPase subunit